MQIGLSVENVLTEFTLLLCYTPIESARYATSNAPIYSCVARNILLYRNVYLMLQIGSRWKSVTTHFVAQDE